MVKEEEEDDAPPSPGPINFVSSPSNSPSNSDSSNTPNLILYAFPHAGGSPASFRDWSSHPALQGAKPGWKLNVEVRTLSLPGRGGRFHEGLWDDWGDEVGGEVDDGTRSAGGTSFVQAVTDAFLSDWDGLTPYVFFGHSFGTLVAYEVCLELERRGLGLASLAGREAQDKMQEGMIGSSSSRMMPLALFVSAHRAPGMSPVLPTTTTPPADDRENKTGGPNKVGHNSHIIEKDTVTKDTAPRQNHPKTEQPKQPYYTHSLPQSDFLNMIREWGLVPDEFLDNDELMDIMVPALRADLRLDELHVPPPPPPPLLPMTTTTTASPSGVHGNDCKDDSGIDGKDHSDVRARCVPVPIVAYGGSLDTTVPPPQLSRWIDVAPPNPNPIPPTTSFASASGTSSETSSEKSSETSTPSSHKTGDDDDAAPPLPPLTPSSSSGTASSTAASSGPSSGTSEASSTTGSGTSEAISYDTSDKLCVTSYKTSDKLYDEVWFDDGGHFYTVTHYDQLMNDLGRRLGKLLEKVPKSVLIGGVDPSSTSSALSFPTSSDKFEGSDLLTVPTLFDRQVARTPNATALVGANGREWTYQSLQDEATWFGRYLHKMLADAGRYQDGITKAKPQPIPPSPSVLSLATTTTDGDDDNEEEEDDAAEEKEEEEGVDGSRPLETKRHPPRVGVYLTHTSPYLLTILATWKACGSIVLLERNWTGALLAEFVEVCGVDVVVTDEVGRGRLREAGLVGDGETVETVPMDDDTTTNDDSNDDDEEKKDDDKGESSLHHHDGKHRPRPRIVVVPPGGIPELKSKTEEAAAAASSPPPSVTSTDDDNDDDDEDVSERKHHQQKPNLDDVALVSMTSGSTGRPSAVLTTHRGCTFCFEARFDLYPYRTTTGGEDGGNSHGDGDDQDDQSQEREGCNVFFAWEVIRPLLRGQTAVIIPDQVLLDPPKFVKFLATSGITRLVVTPSLLDSVLTYPHLGETLGRSLGHMYGVFLMGEVVPMNLVERASKFFPPDVKLINAYSSWEALDVSYADLLPIVTTSTNVSTNLGGGILKTQLYAPVGRPMPNVHAFLLGPDDEPVPRGVPGTLHVLTPGLALAYLDDPVKTSERFRQVPPPVYRALLDAAYPDLKPSDLGLDATQGAVLFNTGDRGRILRDGQLGLLGRGDDTVKLRGYKVALPLVESTLNGIDGVGIAVVLPVMNGATGQPDYLVAYIVGEDGMPSDGLLEEVGKRARDLLPPYAVPRDYVGLDRLPLREGESRKLDRKALPPPPSRGDKSSAEEEEEESKKSNNKAGGVGGPQRNQASEEGTQPKSGLEQIVAQAWAAVLGLDSGRSGPPNRDDNFFDVGGNSLLGSQLIGRLTTEYGLPLSVLDLYQHSTLRALVKYCEELATQRVGGPKKSPKVAAPTRRRFRRGGGRGGDQFSGKIAVVGMAGKFPGANSVKEFWECIKSGTDSLRTFTAAELASRGVPAEVYGHPDWVPVGQVVDDADKFDAAFWGISPREARVMDPQHRVFLEVAWSALEDAGYPPQSHADRARTGVYAACGIDGYMVHHLDGGGLKTPLDPSHQFLTEIGNEKDYISTRVSYQLDLGGPSMTVQSACSSGLVAITQAAQSLMVGQTDVAIAGASSLTFPNFGYSYQEGMVGSVDGHVRPFDEAASGTLFGDGVGAVVLKRLENAIEDGDHIWSLLSGFDVTNDGRLKAGYSAPSASAQRNCIVGALDMAGVSSEQISYVECHATATHVGDAIELQGLAEAFRATAEDGDDVDTVTPQRCALGSVKGNIGHANCAAGITGFIKTVLCLKNRVLAPTAHFSKPNAKLTEFLDPTASPFFVNVGLGAWEVADEERQLPRRAGVSSFGIGGTNAHVVLEEWNGSMERDDGSLVMCPAPISLGTACKSNSDVCVLPVSAKSEAALRRNIENLAAYFHLLSETDEDDENSTSRLPPLRHIAYTLQCGREALSHRATVVVRSHAEAAVALEGLVPVGLSPEKQKGQSFSGGTASVVMCFPGQGSHYPGMARSLYHSSVTGAGNSFRRHFDEVCGQFKDRLGFELRDAVFSNDTDGFAHPNVTQPAIFAVEYALALTLIDCGVCPVAVAGHSIGEYVAATMAGVLKLKDAVMLVSERAKATAELDIEGGGMLFVRMSADDVRERINGKSDLYLAADNGPTLVVVSGTGPALDAFAESLAADNVQCRRLVVTHPFHSKMMKPVADRLVDCAKTIQVGTPRLPVTSNVTGRWVAGDEMSDPEYWGRQMCGTVRWRENVDSILRWSPTAVIEVGPGNTLSSLISKCMAQGDGMMKMKTLTSLPHARDKTTDDTLVFAQLLADLWEAKIDVDWAGYNQQRGDAKDTNAGQALTRVPLPTYSFEKTSYWTNPKSSIYVAPNIEAAVGTTHRDAGKLAPVYQVDWQHLEKIPMTSKEIGVRRELVIVGLDVGGIEIKDDIVAAVRSDAGLGVLLQYPPELLKKPFNSSTLAHEMDIGWIFLRFVQDLTARTMSGRIHLLCPTSMFGALAVGASRSVAQEYPNLRITRVFLPDPGPFAAGRLGHGLSLDDIASLRALLTFHSGETDMLLPDGATAGGRVLAQRLEPVPLRKRSEADVVFGRDDKEDGVYLVTGGTGALGQALVQRLVSQHGVPAEKIVLLTRKCNPGLDFGVRAIQVDCSDLEELRNNDHIKAIPHVAGIFHLAGMLDDGLIINQSFERLEKVVAPKAAAVTLLELARERKWELGFLLAYSSTTSLLGYAGQSNYGAANALLDHMATWSSSDQSTSTIIESAPPVIVVNWGSWGEVGMAAKGTKAYNTAIRQGDLPMPTDTALGALEALFVSLKDKKIPGGQFTICGMNWDSSPWQSLPILDNIIAGVDEKGPSSAEKATSPALSSFKDTEQSVESLLSNHVSRWEPDETLVSLGLDSLDMLQLAKDISKTFDIEFGLQDIVQSGKTLSDFIQHITHQIEGTT